MTPKERRDRLFKNGRPMIRELQVFDGGEYHKDIGVLWVAYKARPFYALGPGLSQEDFAKKIEQLIKEVELLLVDDVNKVYKDKGPVGLVFSRFDGWKVEPHVEYFKWATPRNILRSTVAYLQMMRHKKIGVCVVRALESSKNLLDKCCIYGVLHRVGLVPNGSPMGDEAIYSVRGKA